MGPREADNGPVIKAHAMEHITEVLGSLRSIGKPAMGRALLPIGGIAAPTADLNLGAARKLYSGSTCCHPDVSMAELWVILLDLDTQRKRRTRRVRCL
jgi:hypothetical protein